MQNDVFSFFSIKGEYGPLMKTEFRGQNKNHTLRSKLK